jgi:hypothetical protein
VFALVSVIWCPGKILHCPTERQTVTIEGKVNATIIRKLIIKSLGMSDDEAILHFYFQGILVGTMDGK